MFFMISLSKRRRSLFRIQRLPQIAELAKRGLTNDEVAVSMGVSPACFDGWCRVWPEICDVLDEARGETQLGVIGMDTLTAPQVRFIAALSETGVELEAAKVTGISIHTHSAWLRWHEPYRESVAQAEREAAQRLVAEARRRAVDGIRRLKFYNGQVITIPCKENDPDGWAVNLGGNRVMWVKPYEEFTYSDALLMKLLETYLPEFKETKKVEVNGRHLVLTELLNLSEIKRTDVVDADFVRRAALEYVK